MSDKSILIELVNENVTHPIRPKNSKNPRCLTLRGFFFVFTIQCRFNVYSMSFASVFEVKNFSASMSLQCRVVNNVVFTYLFTFEMRM